MCGIAGAWGPIAAHGEQRNPFGDKLCAALAHRGPDSDGVWGSDTDSLLLVHTRLAIRGLGQSGAQPMRSHSGRFSLVFNGEVYNEGELKALTPALRDSRWRGSSDTEVLLQVIEEMGVERTLQRLDGMFAIAAWDHQERTLYLARDRFGEKPLYYGVFGRSLCFASELGALQVCAGGPLTIDDAAVRDYLRHGYIPAPRSIYREARKLPPGSYLKVVDPASPPSVAQCYFDPVDVALESMGRPFSGSYEDAIEYIGDIFDRSCRSRTVSDVPIAVFLSSGVDSSLVTAAIARGSPAGIRAFTVESQERGIDESSAASAFAAGLGMEHVVLPARAKDALQSVDTLGAMYGEPFADSSALPTALISTAARQHVKVVLSGDGGDELFGGYNRHCRAPRLWSLFRRMPQWSRELAGAPMRGLARELSAKPGGAAARGIRSVFGSSLPGIHLAKLAGAMGATDFPDFYESLACQQGEFLLASGVAADARATLVGESLADSAYAMLRDTVGYLPDDILVKLDRASMSVGLELRSPFLNPELYRAAWSLPLEYRVHRGVGKRILRDLLKARAPHWDSNRPKQGFSIPIDDWLRNELREWAQELLKPSKLAAHGYFEADTVSQLWRQHLDGTPGSTVLWSVLMFQSWYFSRP